jgi:WD40 repeat protein
MCLAWFGAHAVATGCVDGKLRLWDSRSGKRVKTFVPHFGSIQSLDVSANGNYLVFASRDQRACVFEVAKFG